MTAQKIFRAVTAFFALLSLVIPLLLQSGAQRIADIRGQRERLESLRAGYADGTLPHADEAAFFDGDLSAALDGGVRFNALSVIATHNSYQTHSVSAWVRACRQISRVRPDLIPDGTGTLDQEPLTAQLNCGIRSFELDVEAARRFGKTHFYCMHSPVIDMTTSCYDLALALEELRLWSAYNPQHLPITVILEPKLKFVPMGGLRFFNADYADALDDFLRAHLGDRLLTPADMLRGYADFAAMRQADDWLPVREMLGKILVLFHYDWSDDGQIINAYMDADPTFRTQAMFPLHVDPSLPNACFLAFNEPESVLGADRMLRDGRFIVRTRTDAHPFYSDARRDAAFASTAQILSTDYPPRTDAAPDSFAVVFPGGKTARLLPQDG